MPFFLGSGEVVFHETEKGSNFAIRIHEDGTQKRKLTESETNELHGVSPDGRFVVVWNRAESRTSTKAISTFGGAPISILDASCFLLWQKDGRLLYLSVYEGMNSAGAFGRTYVIPVSPDRLLPPMPAGGFSSEGEIARLPGVRVIEAADVYPGPTVGIYAYSRQTVQRNLYRIPLR
jgi:hypothetical protein